MYTKEFELQYQRDEKSALNNIPNWQAKGERFIFPERFNAWVKTVEERANSVFHGGELDAALEIMAQLESGATMEEAKESLMLQGHSMVSRAIVRNLVFSFSILGPEFWESTALIEITPEGKAKIEAKKKENRELAKKNGRDLSIFEKVTGYQRVEMAPQAQSGIDLIDSMRAASEIHKGEDLSTAPNAEALFYRAADLPSQPEQEVSGSTRV